MLWVFNFLSICNFVVYFLGLFYHGWSDGAVDSDDLISQKWSNFKHRVGVDVMVIGKALSTRLRVGRVFRSYCCIFGSIIRNEL